MSTPSTSKPLWQRLVVCASAVVVSFVIVHQSLASRFWETTPQISQTQAEIAQLNTERDALLAQASTLSTREQALVLARENYQLVLPGQRLVQILPAQGAVNATTGDPGFDPLASPTSGSAYLPKGSKNVTTHSTSGFWSRLITSLQFWR
jgi:cell division protein FtsB